MRIDKKLNLVLPIFGEDEATVIAWVHSAPLAAEVVDRYFMTIAQTYSAIFSRGLGVIGGPAIALRLLTQVAKDAKVWDDDPAAGTVGVARGIVEEMRRLTNVLIAEEGGWSQVPLAVAVQRGAISAEDAGAAENAIAFFIVASAMLPRANRRTMLEAGLELLGAQISSLDFTGFNASLRTSTAPASPGEASQPASAPADSPPANAVVDGKPAQVPR